MRRPPLSLFLSALVLVGSACVLFIIAFFPVTIAPSPYLPREAHNTGAANLVAGVYLNYRLYDTIFEVLVFAVAVIGVRYYLIGQNAADKMAEIPESQVVRTSADLLFSPLLLIGAYLVLFGHLFPGGGFAGGVVGGSGLLLCVIALGGDVVARRFHEPLLERFEWGILAMIFIFALVPVLFGLSPFTDLLPKGQAGKLASGGSIPIYNLLIGIKVFTGTWVIIYYFTRHRGEV